MPTPWYPASSNTANRNLRGWKRYELTNHLGNVLAVVSDKHLSQDVDANNKVDFYFADVISAKDYWPFGSVITERQFVASGAGEYRYGFNGKEADAEIDPTNSTYTAEFWKYDSRVVMRWNRDPVPDASRSDYAVLNQNPILNVDPSGALEDDYFNKFGVYLGSDNRSTNDVRVVDGNATYSGNGVVDHTRTESTRLADYDFTGSIFAPQERVMLSGIGNHYYRQAGYNTSNLASGCIGVATGRVGREGVVAFESGGNIRVNIHLNSSTGTYRVNPMLGTSFGFMNTLVHEEYHRVNQESSYDIPDEIHLNAYAAQVAHPSFSRLSASMQAGTIESVRRYIHGAAGVEPNSGDHPRDPSTEGLRPGVDEFVNRQVTRFNTLLQRQGINDIRLQLMPHSATPMLRDITTPRR